MKGIKQRWLRSYLLIPIIILMCFELFFIYFVKEDYYDYVKTEILKNLEITGTIYNKFLAKRSITFDKAIDELYDNTYDDKKMEIQIMDQQGKLIYTSNSEETIKTVKSKDFYQALDGKVGYSIIQYYTNEKVMIVSMPLYFQDRVEGVIRGIVSLTKADQGIRELIKISIVICIIILIIMNFLSWLFSRSIINPIREISRVSKMYAEGDFTKRINNKVYKDEIGELTNSINNMASEIVKAQDVKKQFIASISHELRTPLTAIKGWSETLLDPYNSMDDIVTGISIINQETIRLSQLVEELIDFSRIERNELILEKTEIDLSTLIRSVVKLFEKRSNREEISIYLNIREEIRVIGDDNRLKQVLINVIDNGFKFNNAKGSIEISLSAKDRFAIIEIEDSGVGIEKSQLNKVTDMFYKVNNESKGSGIGLAISKEIIELHGGVFQIYSQSKRGTKIIIKLIIIKTS